MFSWSRDNESGREPNDLYSTLNRKVDLILRSFNVDPGIFMDNTLPASVLDLIARGRKIEAIKEYREYARVGLKEAKDAVEGNAGPSPWVLLNKKVDRVLAELGIQEEHRAIPGLTSWQATEVEELIQSGNIIGAIMVYREKTGLGLADAQAEVYQIAARLRQENGTDR